MRTKSRIKVEAPPGQHVPGWFLTQLERIDPRCRVVYNSEIRCWEIWKDIDVYHEKARGDRRHQVVPMLRAVFDRLDQKAIDNLDARRQIGLKYLDKPGRYWAQIEAEHKANLAKEKDRAWDIIVDGAMTMHRIETSRSFS